jgi:hypothetical protein
MLMHMKHKSYLELLTMWMLHQMKNYSVYVFSEHTLKKVFCTEIQIDYLENRIGKQLKKA